MVGALKLAAARAVLAEGTVPSAAFPLVAVRSAMAPVGAVWLAAWAALVPAGVAAVFSASAVGLVFMTMIVGSAAGREQSAGFLDPGVP